jgi:uncharacterized membrane protein YhhN
MERGAHFSKFLLVAAIVAGGSYLFGMNADLHPSVLLGWKAAGVWFLALYAALNAQDRDGWLITLVMAMGALGDALVERNQTWGAAAFIVGHITAILLYFGNWRPKISFSQRMLAALVVPLSVFIAFGLTGDAQVAVYTFFVSGMAASAWTSRFSRYRTGIGAMLFLVSDLLIFARMGVLSDAEWVTPAIWALYFGGQVLIVTGVIQKLNATSADPPQSFAQ